uniref:Phosphatidylethanolamine-binding protein n=1 Tax=Bionectria ochroleuca TaxID=29856 RepID=A0A0B7K6D1_BIOOC
MVLEEYTLALASSLEKANLVPGSAASLIPQGFKPTTKLNITYGDRPLDLGNLFRVTEVKTAPSVSFPSEDGAPDGASYLLLLVDPDAPTPDDPKFAFWRHWMRRSSKPHRYLFLLFREPKGLDLTKEDVGGEEFVQRRSFDPAAFVSKYGLNLVSVNWMLGAGDGWSE